LFTFSTPTTIFQVWYVGYSYLLPILLCAAWLILSILNISRSGIRSSAVLLLIPLIGGGLYLISAREREGRTARIAAVVVGTVIWLVAVIGAVWLGGGPLGPKALS
jgi:hypothetical protein